MIAIPVRNRTHPPTWAVRACQRDFPLSGRPDNHANAEEPRGVGGMTKVQGGAKPTVTVSETLDHIAGSFPKLLDLLKDLQPLILLSSFSLVIATFATPISPTAAGYAIVASMAFISGFVSLILVRITVTIVKEFSPTPLILLSYTSIGLGIVLLYLVPSELGKAIPGMRPLGAMGSAIGYILMLVWMSDVILVAYRRAKAQGPIRWWITGAFTASISGWAMIVVQSIVEAFAPTARESTLWVALLGGGLFMAGTLGIIESRPARREEDRRADAPEDEPLSGKGPSRPPGATGGG